MKRNSAARNNKPAPKSTPESAPTSAPEDERSPFDYPRPADPMRESIAYSLRDPNTPGGAHVDVVRYSILRKVMTVFGHPARCRDAACRRRKACVGPTMRCDREIPKRNVTPKQGERNLAFLQRELKKRLAELGRA
jgi:hypothetical protein